MKFCAHPVAWFFTFQKTLESLRRFSSPCGSLCPWREAGTEPNLPPVERWCLCATCETSCFHAYAVRCGSPEPRVLFTCKQIDMK